MIRPIARAFLVVALLVASFVAANPVVVPEVAMLEFAPPGDVSLTVVPDGSGTPFSAAWDAAGVPVDATLRIQLVDESGYPWEGFPAEDVWLQYPLDSGTFDTCVELPYYGSVICPDGESDWDGMLVWTLPVRGGGWSEGPVAIYIYGFRALTWGGGEVPALPIRVNSPDISGDLLVDLTDITLFAQDLGGPYHYRSDLCWDGNLDLSDIVIFTQGIGATCP